MYVIYPFMRLAGAGIYALIATYALVGIVVQILAHVYGFWIMTPRATHIAALEENRRSYSGTVIERKTLYIRYHAVHLRIPHYITIYFFDVVKNFFTFRQYNNMSIVSFFADNPQYFCVSLRFFGAQTSFLD